MKYLSIEFPELAAQWDYELNGSLKPDQVTIGSHLKVWWKCSVCGHSYQKRISNRTAPSKRSVESDKCPICLGRVIIPGVNSLKAKYPDIIAKEWDFDRNKIDPDTIAPHRRIKVWWKCPNGHSYDSLPGNKINNSGGDCPYCSSQKLCIETSLGHMNPELAREWHPTRNGELTPFDVFANTNRYIWWLCPSCGYEWRGKASNRNIGKRGCPNCAKGRNTSIPEQLIFRSIKKFFPDAINRHIIDKDEIDIYIPSRGIGIEYDGQRFHNETKLPKDIAKTKRLISKGINLYRFREINCPDISIPLCVVIKVEYTPDYNDLSNKLSDFLSQLFPNTNISIDFSEEINEVRAEVDCLPYENSFAAFQEEKIKKNQNIRALWDYKLNAPLKPEMVTPFSDKIVSWICPNNPAHKWKNTVKSVSLGYGCRKCSPRKLYTTKDWIEEAIKKHGKKYQYHLVKYVNSCTEVEIVCPKHGIFKQLPYEHLSGKGCKYCARQAFHPQESLAVLYPDIASEWDFEKNDITGFTPQTIGIDSKREFWWHCDKGCNHSYKATISYRVHRNSGCSVCHGKQVIYETSFGYLFPKLAQEWCIENDKTPFEVSPGSEYEALWKCSNPNHEPYRCTVYNRTKLSVGCKYCSSKGKKHPKDYEIELYSKHPTIKLLSPYVMSKQKIKCQCEICGHIWDPYPNNLLKSKGCPICISNK